MNSDTYSNRGAELKTRPPVVSPESVKPGVFILGKKFDMLGVHASLLLAQVVRFQARRNGTSVELKEGNVGTPAVGTDEAVTVSRGSIKDPARRLMAAILDRVTLERVLDLLRVRFDAERMPAFVLPADESPAPAGTGPAFVPVSKIVPGSDWQAASALAESLRRHGPYLTSQSAA